MYRRPARPTPTSSGAGSRTSVALVVLIVVLITIRSGVTEFGDVLGTKVRDQLEEVQAKKTRDAKSSTGTKPVPTVPEPLPAEAFLKAYGDPNTQPQEDLTRLAHALEHLAKVTTGSFTNSNDDLAAALLGKNSANVHFLPGNHPVFNSQHQLVDRWGTPLRFSSASAGHWDIQSAGPDKAMDTSDDVYRRRTATVPSSEQLPDK